MFLTGFDAKTMFFFTYVESFLFSCKIVCKRLAKTNSKYILFQSASADKESEMSEVLLYLADKLVDFLLAVLSIVIGYYINKWLDRK